MTTHTTPSTDIPAGRARQRTEGGRSPAAALVTIILVAVIVAAGVAGGVYFMRTKPKAQKRARTQSATLVDVATAKPTKTRVIVEVMGAVVPAQQIALQPRVGGEVVEVSPELRPGGIFRAGDVVLRIDPTDYQLSLAQAQANLVTAEYQRTIELGRQEVAKEEWERRAEKGKATALELELALRKPHLEKAGADLDYAKTAVRKAELDLERATVRAPFNAIVIQDNVDLGAQVTTQTAIAILAGTDKGWVKASVPVDRLEWLTIPQANGDEGSAAVIRFAVGNSTATHKGRIVRLLADLEPQGRMARMLIEVPDPFALKKGGNPGRPLFLDSYVKVAIDGRELTDVYRIPRVALRDGDTIWLMPKDGKMEIRKVAVVWRAKDEVFIRDGVKTGEAIVVSDIAAPVEGLALTTKDILAEKSTGKAESKPQGAQAAEQPDAAPAR